MKKWTSALSSESKDTSESKHNNPGDIFSNSRNKGKLLARYKRLCLEGNHFMLVQDVLS